MLLISARSLPRAAFKQQMVFTGAVNRSFCEKIDKEQSTTTANVAIEKTDEPQTTKLSGFARAFEKHSVPQKAIDNADDKLPDLPFATLLRNSKLMELGDPQNKIVVGKIFHIVDDDLYIDFGWKFHCVCSRPSKNSDAYVRGSRVKLRIKDLELSSRFLGSSKDLTLLEADCQVLGVLSSPAIAQRAKV